MCGGGAEGTTVGGEGQRILLWWTEGRGKRRGWSEETAMGGGTGHYWWGVAGNTKVEG